MDPENPDSKQAEAMVESIHEWLTKQPHLPNIEDRELLLKFLVNCKYRLQKTKTKIENYYSARALLPTFFQNRDPTTPEMKKVVENNHFFELSQTDKDGNKIIIGKLGGDPKDFDATLFTKHMFMVIDFMFHKNATRQDYIIVVDFRGFAAQHFFKYTPIGKVVMDTLQNVFPARLKGVHYVYGGPLVDKVIGFFKLLMKPKLRERYMHHSDIKAFYDSIGDQDIWPSDLGGKQPSITQLSDQYQKKLESYKGWFEKEEQIRSNEDLRPPNSKISWLSGTEGSFKKLSVD